MNLKANIEILEEEDLILQMLRKLIKKQSELDKKLHALIEAREDRDARSK